MVDEVLFAIPKTFPHKQFEGATLDQRVAMLHRLVSAQPRLSVAVADGGLFIDIAREARGFYPGTEIHLLCGRDAAERILTWDYGEPDFADRMLQEFRLLVAPRSGPYVAPERFAHAIRSLSPGNYDECSSTRVREAIRAGGDWKALAPQEVRDLIEEIYQR